MSDSFSAPDLASRAAVLVARSIGFASRAWGQKGLGTLFQYLGRLPVVGGARCTATLAPGARFTTPVFDAYWGPTVLGGRPFEPELLHLLHRFAHTGATFIDCGANFGYWSVIATSPEVGFQDAVAIEPNPPTFARLAENARINGDRFRCVQRAVSDRSGQIVHMAWADQHVVSYVSDEVKEGAPIETITLDDLVAELGWTGQRTFLIKLDVEGLELKTIAGASKLRENREHLIVFEDFPGQSDFAVMRGLLPLGYALFFIDRHGVCHRVADAAEAHRLVAADGKGTRSCNFVVTPPEGSMFERMAAWTRAR